MHEKSDQQIDVKPKITRYKRQSINPVEYRPQYLKHIQTTRQ